MNGTHPLEGRTRLLESLQENRIQLGQLSTLYEKPATSEDPQVSSNEQNGTALTALLEERTRLEGTYLSTLPRIRISRCPFTGTIVEKTIDTIGLDGPWWDYGSPVRPQEPVPETWLGMSGSLSMKESLPKLPFPVMPGPSVPVVYPGLIADLDVRAVLSTVSIGSLQGVAVSWFVRRNRHRFIPPNEWGAPWCDIPDETGFALRGPSVWQLPDTDTDLAAWIRKGKVLWIAPNDASLLLRADMAGCPYLGMDGDGRPQYLVDGERSVLGMLESDMRSENMSDEAFSAAMRMVQAEENGEVE